MRRGLPGLTVLLLIAALKAAPAAAGERTPPDSGSPPAAGSTALTTGVPAQISSGTVHDLLKALRSKDPELRRAVVEVLKVEEPAQIEEAIPVLVQVTVNDPDPRVRSAASRQLARMGQAPASALVLSLGLPDPAVRRNAVEALAEIGPVSDLVIPSLIEALRDARTRDAAGDALARIGPKAVDKLVTALSDKDLSGPAEKALARIGTPAAPAEPLPEPPAGKTRPGAAGVPAQTSPQTAPAVEPAQTLAPAILAPIPQAPPQPAPALTTTPLKPAEKLLTQRPIRVPALVKILRSDDPELRRDAVELLEAEEPAQMREAVPVLVRVTISDPDVRVRYAASWRLAQMGRAPASALVLSLGHSDPAVRLNAVEALAEIGPDSDVVIPALVEALRDPKVRDAAGSALARIGARAVGDLVAALNDKALAEPARDILERIGTAKE